MLEFYSTNQIAALIIMNDQPEAVALVRQVLQKLVDHRVDIEASKQGKKLNLVKFVMDNIQYGIEKNSKQILPNITFLSLKNCSAY